MALVQSQVGRLSQPGSHLHWPHSQTPWPPQNASAQGAVEHEQSTPVHPAWQTHVPQEHLVELWPSQMPLAVLGQGAVEHEQSFLGPRDQPGRHSHTPQLQLPWQAPEQSFGQGSCEQLQAGPPNATGSRQLHSPQAQVPLVTPLHGRPDGRAMGQPPVMQEQSAPL